MKSTLAFLFPLARTALAAALLTAASCAAAAASDDDFLGAKSAYERGDAQRLDAIAPALAGHPLERYVRFWQLKLRLDETTPEAVDDFLARYPDGPLTERLRVEWLKALARRADWS